MPPRSHEAPRPRRSSRPRAMKFSNHIPVGTALWPPASRGAGGVLIVDEQSRSCGKGLRRPMIDPEPDSVRCAVVRRQERNEREGAHRDRVLEVPGCSSSWTLVSHW